MLEVRPSGSLQWQAAVRAAQQTMRLGCTPLSPRIRSPITKTPTNLINGDLLYYQEAGSSSGPDDLTIGVIRVQELRV